VTPHWWPARNPRSWPRSAHCLLQIECSMVLNHDAPPCWHGCSRHRWWAGSLFRRQTPGRYFPFFVCSMPSCVRTVTSVCTWLASTRNYLKSCLSLATSASSIVPATIHGLPVIGFLSFWTLLTSWSFIWILNARSWIHYSWMMIYMTAHISFINPVAILTNKFIRHSFAAT